MSCRDNHFLKPVFIYRMNFGKINEPGKGVLKPVLREGEAVAEVEVLEIDMGLSRVKVRIGGKESLLTFN